MEVYFDRLGGRLGNVEETTSVYACFELVHQNGMHRSWPTT